MRTSTHTATLVRSVRSLPEIPEGMRVCLDLETTSGDPKRPALDPQRDRIAGVALGTWDGNSWYIPLNHHWGSFDDPQDGNLPWDEVKPWLQSLFDDESREIFGINFKFDLRFLMHAGIKVRCKVACVMPLARLVDNTHGSLALNPLCEYYRVPMKDDEELKQYLADERTQDYGVAPIDMMTTYATGDIFSTYKLRAELESLLPEDSRPVWETEKALTKVLAESEVRGVHIDTKSMRMDRVVGLSKLSDMLTRLHELAGWEVNPRSTNQVTELLCDQFGYEPTEFSPKTRKPKWDKEVMKNLVMPEEAGEAGHECGEILRSFGHLAWFESSILGGWADRADVHHVLRTDWRPERARTGRFSSVDPNLQNTTKESQRYVIPPPPEDDGEEWCIVGADWSQIEYRIFSHYSRDPNIYDAYLADPLSDFHQATADMLKVPRSLGKMLNFAFIFGMGKAKLLLSLQRALHTLENRDEIMEQLRTIAREEYGRELLGLKHAAELVYALYHKKFPSIKKWADKVMGVAKSRGWVRNLFGRRYQFGRYAAQPQRMHKAVNYLVQGSAGDLLKRKIVEMEPIAQKYDARFFITVHDMVGYYVRVKDAPAFYAEMKRCLEDVPELDVPVIADGFVATNNMAAKCEPESATESHVLDALEKSRTLTGAEYSVLLSVGKYVASASGL